MKSPIKQAVDKAVDTLEPLVSTQTSRTGHTANRINNAINNGVDPDVIALQMTKNSKRNNPQNPTTFTEQDIISANKVFEANKSSVAITKAQTTALIEEQQASNEEKLVPAT